MKLSIITPIYKRAKVLPKYFEKLSEQTNSDFELVLVVDTNNERVLRYIDKYKKTIKGQIKVIFNSKRYGRNNAIEQAVELASGDYSIIISASNKINENTVDQLLKIIEEKKSDIIEFRARFWSPIRYKGRIRKKYNKKVKIKDNKDIFAYTQPFEFNKIIKTSILEEVVKMPVFTKRTNSRYSIELFFKALLIAETYSTSNSKVVRSREDKDILFNPLKLSREWDEITSKKIFKDYHEELVYNQYFTHKVILNGYLGSTRNKILRNKFDAEMNKKFKSNSTFFEANQYYIRKNRETDLLKVNKNKRANRLFREF